MNDPEGTYMLEVTNKMTKFWRKFETNVMKPDFHCWLEKDNSRLFGLKQVNRIRNATNE